MLVKWGPSRNIMYYSVTRNFAILTQSWWDAKFYICINAFGVEIGSLMVPKIIAQRKALISGEYSAFIRVICLKLSSLTFRTTMDKFVSFIELVVHFLKRCTVSSRYVMVEAKLILFLLKISKLFEINHGYRRVLTSARGWVGEHILFHFVHISLQYIYEGRRNPLSISWNAIPW